MDTNKATFEQAVLARLPAIEPDEMEFVQRAIADCFEKKFTVMEAAMKLRFLEHVDPVVDEDVALAGMKRVDEMVASRLKHETANKE